MAESDTQQLFDMWRRQMEEGAQAWLRMVSQGAAPTPVDPTAFWKPFMDQSMAAWARLMSQGGGSPELMGQWKQFLDQWIAAWARVLEQAMGTETFARMLGQQLEGALNVAGPIRKAAEQQMEAGLASLGVPSRAQVVNLARQVVQVEDKIDGLEQRLDAVLKQLAELAAALGRERP